MPENAAAHFALCRRGRRRRNDLSAPGVAFSRYTVRERGEQTGAGTTSRHAGDSRGSALLCTAFSSGLGLGQAQADPSEETIAHGKALAIAGDCASCHTADPAKPFAGGKRIDTPFGAIYSPNLTPDRETGLGAWSDEDFVRAFRSRRGARRLALLPGIPLSVFHQAHPPGPAGDPRLSRDARPLQQHAPVAAIALAAELPRGDAAVGLPVLPARHLRAGPAEKRGMESRRLSGRGVSRIAARATRPRTSSSPTGAAAPSAADRSTAGLRHASTTPPRSGLKSWSVDDIVEYLQSGRNGKSHADGPMAEVVVNSTSKMSDADVRAIAVYLKDLPAGAPEPAVAPPPPAEMSGGQGALRPRLHRLPRSRRQRRPADLSAAARQCQSAVRRSRQHAAHHPRRRADGDDTARAQYRIDAGICQANVGSADRRRHQLHPQFLGQRGAAGERGGGREGAEVAMEPRSSRRSNGSPEMA